MLPSECARCLRRQRTLLFSYLVASFARFRSIVADQVSECQARASSVIVVIAMRLEKVFRSMSPPESFISP